MNKLLLIYSAVIFIAGVILFTYTRIKKSIQAASTQPQEDLENFEIDESTEEVEDEKKKANDEEVETKLFYKWMTIFSVILFVIAAVCLWLSFRK